MIICLRILGALCLHMHAGVSNAQTVKYPRVDPELLGTGECCNNFGSMHNIDWVGSAGAWCFLNEANTTGTHCVPHCTHPSGRDINLVCPPGQDKSCPEGCIPGVELPGITFPRNPTACAFDAGSASADGEHRPCTADDLFTWIRSRGGFIDSRLELSTGPDPNASLRGVFATADIEQDEEIMTIPWDCIIDGQMSGLEDQQCGTIEDLRRELALGTASTKWPYVKILMEHVPDQPNAWTATERSLLDGLPPEGWTRHSAFFETNCKGNLSDPLAVRALLLYVARSDPTGMTPGFDMFNHRGGSWTSIGARWKVGERAVITTLGKVVAGQQLYNNFLPLHQGTPDCFRDYGFVEAPPQRWFFFSDGVRHTFNIEDDGSVALVPLPLGAAYRRRNFINAGRQLLQHIARRRDLEDTTDGSSHRKALARSYREAFSHALSLAVDAAAHQSRTEL